MANTKITSRVIADNAVTSSAIADGAITESKLASGVGGVAGIVSNADATAITIDSSERVGIGTSNPSSKLHVSNGSAGIQLSPDGISDGISFLQAYDWVAQTYDGLRYYANEHYFYTGNNERMRIDSSGNVGIGITNPSTRTHIYSSASSTPLIVESTANTYVGIKNTTQTAYIGAVTSNMYFENNGAERMRITSTGNVFLQTGGAALQWQNGYQTITGDAASNDLIYRTYANHIWKTTTGASSTTDGTERMRINSNGEGLYVYNNGGGNPVDYGTGAEIRLDGLSHGINATHYLALSGYLPGYNPGQYNCLKTDLGDMHFAAGGVYTGYIGANTGFTDVSDEREKENIVTISNATAKLKQLRGVYHTWKDTENRGTDTHIGLIAQEVEAVVPEVVSTSNPTSLNTPESDTVGLKGVAYAKLVPLLIETIKELETRIETLENS